MEGETESTSNPELEGELVELLGARAGGEWSANIVGWCTKSLVHLIRTDPESPERRLLSVWGAGVTKMLLVGLLKRKEILPVSLCVWLRDNIVPALFDDTAEDGVVVTMHADLVHLLLQCLLQTMQVVEEMPRGVSNPSVPKRSAKRQKRR